MTKNTTKVGIQYLPLTLSKTEGLSAEGWFDYFKGNKIHIMGDAKKIISSQLKNPTKGVLHEIALVDSGIITKGQRDSLWKRMV